MFVVKYQYESTMHKHAIQIAWTPSYNDFVLATGNWLSTNATKLAFCTTIIDNQLVLLGLSKYPN